jgi:hypothetical protein
LAAQADAVAGVGLACFHFLALDRKRVHLGILRATINLPDDLIRLAKKAAQESGITLSKLIENALRDELARRRSGKQRRVIKLTTSGSGGLLPGVNLDDSSAAQDIMEPPEEIRKKLMG